MTPTIGIAHLFLFVRVVILLVIIRYRVCLVALGKLCLYVSNFCLGYVDLLERQVLESLAEVPYLLVDLHVLESTLTQSLFTGFE